MLVLGERVPVPFDSTNAGEREVLAAAGARLEIVDTIEQWRDLAPEAVGVLHNVFRLGAADLERLTQCRCIAHNAVGVDMIDTAAAARLGIVVTNVPRYGTDDVADQAMMLLLACARRLFDQVEMGREVPWNYERVVPIYRLRGKTLGIVGLGNIGSAVAQRARGFGLRVLAYDPYQPPSQFAAAGAEASAFDELLDRSDFLTVHTPLTPETRGMVDAAALARLRPGAIVINVARGPIIDTAALIDALESDHLAAAAVDVYDFEPAPLDHPLRRAPRTILTPHCAFYSTSSVRSMQVDPAREIAATLRGEIPPNPAKLPGIDWTYAFERWGLQPPPGGND